MRTSRRNVTMIAWVGGWIAAIIHEGAHVIMARVLAVPVEVSFGWPVIWRWSSTLQVGFPIPTGRIDLVGRSPTRHHMAVGLAGLLANLIVGFFGLSVVAATVLARQPWQSVDLLIGLSLMQGLYGFASLVGWDGKILLEILGEPPKTTSQEGE